MLVSFFIRISPEYRVLRQAIDFLPSIYVDARIVFTVRLLALGGAYFTSWQVAPILYAVLVVVCMAAGRQAWGRYLLRG